MTSTTPPPTSSPPIADRLLLGGSILCLVVAGAAWGLCLVLPPAVTLFIYALAEFVVDDPHVVLEVLYVFAAMFAMLLGFGLLALGLIVAALAHCSGLVAVVFWLRNGRSDRPRALWRWLVGGVLFLLHGACVAVVGLTLLYYVIDTKLLS